MGWSLLCSCMTNFTPLQGMRMTSLYSMYLVHPGSTTAMPDVAQDGQAPTPTSSPAAPTAQPQQVLTVLYGMHSNIMLTVRARYICAKVHAWGMQGHTELFPCWELADPSLIG